MPLVLLWRAMIKALTLSRRGNDRCNCSLLPRRLLLVLYANLLEAHFLLCLLPLILQGDLLKLLLLLKRSVQTVDRCVRFAANLHHTLCPDRLTTALPWSLLR